MKLLPAALLLTLAACSRPPESHAVRVGLVAKSLGNGFFTAVHKGGDEAALELGGVEVVFTGPTTPTAEGQIEVINALVAQHVDAIAISANDPDALVPSLQRARKRGITVISYDSSVAPAGRLVHLSPSSDELIGTTCMQLAAAGAPSGRGQVAILSATPTSTNQNAWIAAMKKAARRYPGLIIVDTVYGDDLADKSYREAVALSKRYPDLAVIVSPSSVGIVAAAKAMEDEGLSGKIRVTGLGLPSELAEHVKQGTVKSFAIWNPIDLGYATIELAVRIVRGTPAGPGTDLSMGRLGSVHFGADGSGPMGKPFVYDATNIDQFAAVF